MSNWDHSSHQEFFNYYAAESETPGALQRFRSIRDAVLRILEKETGDVGCLEVLDVGCGAGTQSMLWAEAGHRVHALDVNQPLLDLGKQRAINSGYHVDFRLGSASELPWPKESMDVCLVIELLEHVDKWGRCLEEFVRVLKPGGMLFVTTSNKLCPIQQEFNLPLYSWYPAPVKHYFERLALTTHPQLANFAKYPAVNWFSFYSLRKVMAARGFRCLDRFDVIDLSKKSPLQRFIVLVIRYSSACRWLAHVGTPGTMIACIKTPAGAPFKS
jgi:2-polyprenyl-6-hydroxyphenyl methylase/3-demethylubiquinone-9 3-methyltransferase